ncbi:DegT/DnrJ/EryC1/StrS aminotransferase family protein [Paracoccus sp. (in: a-proteobacteria)]|uniref:DegT/DnrJ/EryC1/StrS family aminotransferase n=1 Tax=Paracoccus sp. TaxID=267 RepID=UPI0026DF0290|nr:DegT/DnrJ/EryC1/StrS family aminotransferase [Paracoccus sp. (in: a-proteobacteria)]MDO5647479.1 DegT/DnrJ/EryC1/StrS family aminotransferase [Paracoccus sp. (in: a-proteobacteria)]
MTTHRTDRVLSVGQPIVPDPVRLAALMGESLAAGWLTNGGPLHQRLERAIAPRLGGGSIGLVSSGTMALMVALRLGDLPPGAEIITPAISFAATAQAIAWCGFRPVFADVDPDTLTLCPDAARAAITPRTAAILPVHFLGHPCDLDGLAAVARDAGLWLAYDAAHAFGLTVQGRAISEWGDASAFSFHATKLFHTGEGGAVVLPPPGQTQRIARLRNFGLSNGRMAGPGINAKLPESAAAMGLAVLPELDAEIAARGRLRAAYDAALPGMGQHRARAGVSDSLLYYALRLPPARRASAVAALADARILARDTFPLLCGPGTCFPDAPIITARTEPTAPTVAPQVMALPFHGGVTDTDVARIGAILRGL